MNSNTGFFHLTLCLVLFAVCNSFSHAVQFDNSEVTGAWQFADGSRQHIMIFADSYFTYTAFDKANKQFISSLGGTCKVENNQLVTRKEFDTQQNEGVGQSNSYPFSVEGDKLTAEINGNKMSFTRIDNGKGLLAGTWRISGRMQDAKMSAINDGPRKTLKILSGTRFQWAAINTETKEFFGTGGGTYTFTNGKYTENIEFFPRDSSRVGISLSFEGKVENDQWHHSGLSSRGENIHEIWTRIR